MRQKTVASTFLFIFLFFVTMSFGQIKLTFTAAINLQNIRLDTVKIRNLDKSCDTALYWPDTLLSINALGVNDLPSASAEFQLFQNVPNPVLEQTKIVLFLPESGAVAIEILRMNGNQVATISKDLKRGYHSFVFTPQNSENYILTATHNSTRKSIRIVSTKTGSTSGPSLAYLAPDENLTPLKPTVISGKFTFAIGDLLAFIGYHNGLTVTFEDAPTTNKLFTFNFSATGTPCPGLPIVSYLGTTYNTVQIGTQCWLRENLNVGTRIDGNENQTDNGIIEKYCPEDIPANCKIYGGLYQWDEMMQYVITQGAKGVCPTGWHIPTDSEWTKLISYLGGETTAGGKMKYKGTIEAGTGLWSAPNAGSTNISGFTVLPAGGRDYSGSYDPLGFFAYFWASTVGGTTETPWSRNLNYNYENVSRMSPSKSYGLSVRCIKGS
jgi:uncharacterized protein (TIGR02145 family)